MTFVGDQDVLELDIHVRIACRVMKAAQSGCQLREYRSQQGEIINQHALSDASVFSLVVVVTSHEIVQVSIATVFQMHVVPSFLLPFDHDGLLSVEGVDLNNVRMPFQLLSNFELCLGVAGCIGALLWLEHFDAVQLLYVFSASSEDLSLEAVAEKLLCLVHDLASTGFHQIIVPG